MTARKTASGGRRAPKSAKAADGNPLGKSPSRPLASQHIAQYSYINLGIFEAVRRKRGEVSELREVAETWFQRVWAEEDESAIDEMLVPETTAKGLGEEPREGPAEFKAFHRLLLSMIKDVRVDIDRFVEQDDWAHILCSLKAKRRDTGEPVEMSGQIAVRISDGKLITAHNHFDFMSLFEQLGLLPKGAFSRCLYREKIA